MTENVGRRSFLGRGAAAAAVGVAAAAALNRPAAAYAVTTSGGLSGFENSGVTTGGSTDQAATLQAEIDAMAAAGGGELRLPRGVINISSITLKHNVSLRGAGREVTILKQIATPATAKGAVCINTGPVFTNLSELWIQGTGIASQHGLYVYAQGSGGTPNNGGWWFSYLNAVKVSGFAGDQIWLRGGGSDFLKPIQFITFKDVIAFTTGTRAALRMTGQVGQINMQQCEFDGPGQSNAGTNVFMGRCVDDNLNVIDSTSAYFVTAVNVTSQSNKKAVVLESATAISWTGYFEAISEAVSADVGCQNVVVEGCTMGNVGHNAGAGFCIKTAGNSQLFAGSNVFGNTADVHLLNSGGTLWHKNNYISGGVAVKTQGLTGQVSVDAAGTLNTYGVRTCAVNASATTIINVTSYTASEGETLSLMASGGTIKLGSGGNINASGLTMPVTVPANAIVTLIRYDLGGTAWHIQSITP